MSEGSNLEKNTPDTSSNGNRSNETSSNSDKPSSKNKLRFDVSKWVKQSTPPNGRGPVTPGKNGLWTWVLFGIAVIALVSIYSTPSDFSVKEIPISEFKDRVRSGELKRVIISPNMVKGFTEDTPAATTPALRRGAPAATYYTSIVPPEPFDDGRQLTQIMEEKHVKYEAENMVVKNFFWQWVLPFLVLIVIWRLVFSRAFRMGPGAGIMSFGKNRAKLVVDDSKKVTFADVAGVEEAKEELMEIIDFLKTPQKFRAIGGKIPKGILLVGPPGTGKTLIAKAVAGEAGVPFFSLSGSEFVEMFVGVGAARVRDLFSQAVEKSPCIIFIDELDAIGKVRSSVSPMGGHDEREQTLNQLLVEMDGFDTRTGVIIMAATNRPETLDPALLRAGRFDRQVLVDRPDILGRAAILKIHARNVKMAVTVDLNVVAARTPGFVGADLANVVNEAALLAVRKGKSEVGMTDFDEAIDRVIAGLQKKTRLINEKEKRIVAHHEMGHALATYFTEGTDPVHKISIIPRGFGALGFTMNLPKEDRYLMTKPELLGRIDILLGGRVAEEVIFNEISTGASDDLNKATDIAKAMVMQYGMSSFGQRTFAADRSTFLQGPGGLSNPRDYSDATAERIDSEIQGILDSAHDRVTKLITTKRGLLEYTAAILSEKEVIEGKELVDLIRAFEEGRAKPVSEAVRELKEALLNPPPVEPVAPAAPEKPADPNWLGDAPTPVPT